MMNNLIYWCIAFVLKLSYLFLIVKKIGIMHLSAENAD